MHRLTSYIRQHHVALLALFVALGGVSYAAVNLPKNSVGSPQIQKNAVKAPELALRSVGSLEVKNRSLSCADLARAICDRGDGAGDVTVRSATEPLQVTSCADSFGDRQCHAQGYVTAKCRAGERATGGGWEPVSTPFPGGAGNPGEVMTTSSLDPDGGELPSSLGGTPNGWSVGAVGVSYRRQSTVDPPPPTFTVFVVCASP